MSEEEENLEIKDAKPKFSFLPPVHSKAWEVFTSYQFLAQLYDSLNMDMNPIANGLDDHIARFAMLDNWEECARIMEDGAKKYSPMGWKNLDPKIYFEALLRHEFYHIMDNIRDPESGYLHQSHVLANLLILRELLA